MATITSPVLAPARASADDVSATAATQSPPASASGGGGGAGGGSSSSSSRNVSNNDDVAATHAPSGAASRERAAALSAEVEQLRQALAEKEAQLRGCASVAKRSKKKSQANLIDTEPVQGCRDFPPDEMAVRNYLFDTFRRTAECFGFAEYDAPVLESEELYIRKAGEEITEQMYNFVTKGNHRVTLRPEMTPTLARLLLARRHSLLLPVKWYSIPQCWRYEAITRGRRREHYQWNMDIVGVKAVTAEVELVCALCTALERFGLTARDVGVKVNSRKILQAVLAGAGVTDDKFAPVCVIVDKLEKLPREEVEAQLAALGLAAGVVDRITSALALRTLDDMAGVVGEGHEVVAELRAFFDLVTAYGFGEWVQFDASVVRGLAYYTGIVFEAFDRDGKFRALCGGGRYDNLLTLYGSPTPIACAGFGFGDCVILELLREKQLLPALSHHVDDVVIPFDKSMRANALRVLRRLREQGRRADVILDGHKIANAFSYADRVQATRAVLVAPDEWARGEVTVKMLRESAGKESKNRGSVVALDEL